ncbi:MAG: UvrD-helicase domain-containing protein [Euryarchaeota archaeon]|nr:UvrD-helicase domain-containing protein [Euryarchaeota archaeon]
MKLSPPLPKTPPAPLNQTHPAPQLILAGAGKTTTITAKIAYMVEKENIDPSHILVLIIDIIFDVKVIHILTRKVSKWINCISFHLEYGIAGYY